MFKKNKDIIIRTNEIPINILKNFLLSFPDNVPSYFKNIKSVFFDHKKRPIRCEKNIKTCSGFINLFKRSIVFTSPFDIELFIDDEKIRGRVGGSNWDRYIQYHSNSQFLSHIKSDWKMVLKFMPYCSIQSPYNLIISDPWWHMNNFQIIPGIINCKEPLDLNIFIPIKKNQNYLYISQGTPLAYINFETNDQINLIYENKRYIQSHWMGLHYMFSALKKRLVKNIVSKTLHKN